MNLKTWFFGLITGGILFGGIGVMATTYFSSSDVSFTPTDDSWDVSNVQDAIDSLYSIADNNEASSLIYLGTESSYDIKTLYPDIYSTLTVDNFIVEVNSASSYGTSMHSPASDTWTQSYRGFSSYTNSKEYNSETGILTITATLNTKTQNNTCGSGTEGCTYWRTGTDNISDLNKKVYLFY